MTSCCCWFIQPASEISKSRKGSRARVIATSYTPERPLARQTALSMAFCFQRDRVFGHYGVIRRFPMTRLRKIMLEELERRNYSEGTIRCYLRAVADFARYFHRSPDQLRPEHVREYQAYLFRERKLQATSVTQRLAAL